MFVLFGSKRFERTLLTAGPERCPFCNQYTQYAILRVIRWFTLYFIPLIPYSFKYYRVCGYCQSKVLMDRKVVKTIIKWKQPQAAESAVR